MKLFKQLIGGILLYITFSELTVAGTLYRCGNVYQDLPCQDVTNSKIIKKSTVGANQDPKQLNQSQRFEKVDADCKQSGEAAKKIMWAREGGRTQDDQLETAPDNATRDIIKEVYKRKGSSLEVRDVIEQECMLQKEKEKLALQLEIEAIRLRSKSK